MIDFEQKKNNLTLFLALETCEINRSEQTDESGVKKLEDLLCRLSQWNDDTAQGKNAASYEGFELECEEALKLLESLKQQKNFSNAIRSRVSSCADDLEDLRESYSQHGISSFP